MACTGAAFGPEDGPWSTCLCDDPTLFVDEDAVAVTILAGYEMVVFLLPGGLGGGEGGTEGKATVDGAFDINAPAAGATAGTARSRAGVDVPGSVDLPGSAGSAARFEGETPGAIPAGLPAAASIGSGESGGL